MRTPSSKDHFESSYWAGDTDDSFEAAMFQKAQAFGRVAQVPGIDWDRLIWSQERVTRLKEESERSLREWFDKSREICDKYPGELCEDVQRLQGISDEFAEGEIPQESIGLFDNRGRTLAQYNDCRRQLREWKAKVNAPVALAGPLPRIDPSLD